MYELTPVGDCTVSDAGLILQSNSTAAKLLGLARGALAKSPFSRFVVREKQDGYYHLCTQLLTTGQPQTRELHMLESGRLSLEPISLAEVLADCEAMIEPQAQKRSARTHFPSIESPCFVNANRTRMKQVLINLLSNAIKYNRVGGKVDVACRASRAQRLRIGVRDIGLVVSLRLVESIDGWRHRRGKHRRRGQRVLV
jgi:signal transduction histidine kinase